MKQMYHYQHVFYTFICYHDFLFYKLLLICFKSNSFLFLLFVLHILQNKKKSVKKNNVVLLFETLETTRA